METETINKETEQIRETPQSTAGFYKKASLSILEAYKKQLETSSDWWKKCIELTVNSGFPKKSTEVFPALIRKNAETYQKTLHETIDLSKEVTEKILNAWGKENSFKAVSGEESDAVLNIFRKQGELITHSGKQFLDSIKDYNLEDHQKQFDFLFSDTIKSAEKSIEYFMKEYNLKAEFTQKSTEQLTANITKQFDGLTDMNAKFFGELFKSFETEKKVVIGEKAPADKTTNKK